MDAQDEPDVTGVGGSGSLDSRDNGNDGMGARASRRVCRRVKLIQPEGLEPRAGDEAI